ncbi:TetR/AcrR family transcriptional regulator [Frondihabitans australicus]|uniref:TetR family transcriptional regulator n=1 Tax=Frondihabitans australicus TaxID=386892 RepID=A0A495IET9_9MICO|nr:TetR/AcrR family transcriptional regulator [Frondihabitans australicus]RKR74503.1 TetR family transcriptional regulator [Frondihabitans australicus]
MTVEFPPSAVQRSLGEASPALQPGPGAKQRVLVTADRLFYDEGIRTVGVDRLIAESSVTKATFYKHFGAKDNLVLDYMRRRRDDAMATVDEIRADAGSPLDALRELLASISDEIQAPGFRGCPFVNAAAEFAEPEHPVRQIVVQHREWYTDALVTLFREAGHPMSGDAADEFYLARDGAMVAGYAGDAIAATSAMARVTERLFADCA